MTLRQETVVAFVSALCLVHQVPQVPQVPQPQLASYLNISKLVSNLFLLSAKSDCQVLNHKTYKESLGWGRGYPPLYEYVHSVSCLELRVAKWTVWLRGPIYPEPL